MGDCRGIDRNDYLYQDDLDLPEYILYSGQTGLESDRLVEQFWRELLTHASEVADDMGKLSLSFKPYLALARWHGGEIASCRLGIWLGIGLVCATFGDDVGVDVELAAIFVQQGFLVGNQFVAHVDFSLGGIPWRDAHRDGVGDRAPAGHNIGVDPEQTPIGVQQILLVGD